MQPAITPVNNSGTAGHVVTANDVRAMLGVLAAEPNVAKAFVTTTSDFAPGIYADPRFTQFMPYRLERRPRDALLAWLGRISKEAAGKRP